MVEQEGVVAAIESLLGDQTHRTVEVEGFKVKTDIIKKEKGFSVEKTYGLEESLRFELDHDGQIMEVLIFDNVALELTRQGPSAFYEESLGGIIKEATEQT